MAKAARKATKSAAFPDNPPDPSDSAPLSTDPAGGSEESSAVLSQRIRELAKPKSHTDALVASIADQLCAIVDDNYNIRIRLDSEDKAESLQVQKLTVLINSLLENVRRNIGSLSELAEELETKVRERTLKLDLIIQSSNDGVWLWDLRDDTVEYSSRWRQILGIENEQLSSIEDWLQRVHPDDNERLRAAIRAHLQGSARFLREDYRILHADGTYRWVWCRGRCHRDESGQPIQMAGTQTDVHYLRSMDASSGLPNESTLISALEKKMEQGVLFRAMVIGVPRAVSMKEELSSEELEILRRAVARRLSSALPFSADLAHLSGEFYAALLPGNMSSDNFETEMLGPVIEAFSRPFETGLRATWLDVAIGVTMPVGQIKTSASEVMRDAWTSYRCARAAGERVNILNEAQVEAARDRVFMQKEVRRALERGWIVPYFQPIVEIKTQKILGYEILCRMEHPELGTLLPARFIPIAEDMGILDVIGEHMLKAALGQLSIWAGSGTQQSRLFLSVNLEARQMMQPDFPAKLEAALRENAIPPENLKLELVESSLVSSFDAAARQIALVRDIGVKIALDDFGTGYSSLEYLNQLSFDLIKIDRTFVEDVECDPRKKSMIKMICVLADTLGAQVCVEGIETETQAAIISEMNVDLGQGYLFSRPMSRDDLHSLH